VIEDDKQRLGYETPVPTSKRSSRFGWRVWWAFPPLVLIALVLAAFWKTGAWQPIYWKFSPPLP
jgi:hypothetical protein